MTTYPLEPLGSLGTVTTGSTPKTSRDDFYGGNIPFVTPADLDQDSPVIATTRTLTAVGAMEARILAEDTVMVCCIGSLGKVGIAGRPVATNQQINSITFDPNLVWPRFGFYACRQLRPKLEGMAPATTVPIVSKSKFERLEIPLPPLQEQRRIAAILDQADSLRAKRRVAIAELDTLTQSIFVEMFGDPTRNPKGWPVAPLSTLIPTEDKINYGVVQPGDHVDDGVPLIRVGDLLGGRVLHDRLKHIDPQIEATHKPSRLRGDEILVSCVGTIGVIALADESVKGFNIARAVARIPLRDDTDRVYLSAQLRTAAIQRYFISELRTVSQPTLNIKQLSETMVMIPPLNMQAAFGDRVRDIRALQERQTASLVLLDSLFASLQHRAFRGEL